MKQIYTHLRVLALAAVWMTTAGFGEALFAPKPEPWPKWETHNPNGKIRADHTAWDQFLERYRSLGSQDVARLDYSAVTDEDRDRLNAYLATLSEFPVLSANRAEQFAYWVNLYNSLTAKVILDAYPVESIRDIDLGNGWFSDGPWDVKLVEVEGEPVSLNDIEHRILRPVWNDPRIHYVVNCASIGCPNLPARAMSAEGLEAQLDEAARTYVNHPRGVTIDGDEATLSKIYGWFRPDFGNSGPAVVRHLKIYAEPDLRQALEQVDAYNLGFAYDWGLNDVVR